MEVALPNVLTPALIVQGTNDPVVNPTSAQLIFERVNTRHKELTLFERGQHGILEGEGSQHVFERVVQFLQHAPPRLDPGILAGAGVEGEAPSVNS